jgi:hypothetical protein
MTNKNAINWQPWAGLDALPDDADLLFCTTERDSFCIGSVEMGWCEITLNSGFWKPVEDDGTFDGGRITHYAVITPPEK